MVDFYGICFFIHLRQFLTSLSLFLEIQVLIGTVCSKVLQGTLNVFLTAKLQIVNMHGWVIWERVLAKFYYYFIGNPESWNQIHISSRNDVTLKLHFTVLINICIASQMDLEMNKWMKCCWCVVSSYDRIVMSVQNFTLLCLTQLNSNIKMSPIR